MGKWPFLLILLQSALIKLLYDLIDGRFSSFFIGFFKLYIFFLFKIGLLYNDVDLIEDFFFEFSFIVVGFMTVLF